MKIKFFGAAKEVGRSCVVIESNNEKYMLDCGLKFGKYGNEYPLKFDVTKIDATFISHAHLDHTGALPLFNSQGLNCPIFTTAETKEITRILLKDSLHIEMLNGTYPHYDEEHIYHVLGAMRRVNYKETSSFSNIEYTFYDAGHIPGSASILLTVEGKNILYTGDIQTNESELLPPADTNYDKKVDILICESTYGIREHVPRQNEESKFIKEIENALLDGGSAIIPAFGVGRAQEIILLLDKLNIKVPIYLDGMAKKVTNLFLQKPQFLKDANHLKKVLRKIKYVQGKHMRERLIRENSVIISTSGMVTGGPVMFYLDKFKNDKKTVILLTGYQAEGTNGRTLLSKGMVKIDDKPTKIKCKVRQFDFSAHSGLKGLKNLILKINPKVLLLNHGDQTSEDNLEGWARNKNFEVHSLALGECYDGH